MVQCIGGTYILPINSENVTFMRSTNCFRLPLGVQREFPRATILLLSADPELRTTFASFLRSKNFSLVLASTRVEAIMTATQAKPQLALIDAASNFSENLYMGEWLIRETQTPFVVLADPNQAELSEQATRFGASGIWIKPLLFQVVESEISMRIAHATEVDYLRKERKRLLDEFDRRKPVDVAIGFIMGYLGYSLHHATEFLNNAAYHAACTPEHLAGKIITGECHVKDILDGKSVTAPEKVARSTPGQVENLIPKRDTQSRS